MSTAAVAAIKAAILALTDESTRKKIGWVLVADRKSTRLNSSH